MRNTSVSLFDFFEMAFGLIGFSRTTGLRLGDAASPAMPRGGMRQTAGPANENGVRGLTPIVSMAVSVCPVSPVVKRT
ncbi:hypothetical protein EOI86_05510 [Hwanghaeella grinnelliae]|uniref:Uncharacterized protein n=1 Tax=Hwanghaeella grinnelliae TaxID=2500179 RepID=A0A437QW38_9PROT|nr:hypothetical protein [Hwanghaeella grinnelliae]RVU38728.1 hypothetical protein EOI86_05510 [Hwanghaeella grinnelliae]